MAAERTLIVKIAGDTKGLSAAMGRANTLLGSLGPMAAAAGAAVAAGLAAGAANGVRRFAEFEQGMREVFTLLPGISDEAMGQLSDDLRAFSVEMGVATQEAIPALYQALSAGVPEDTVFDFLEVANQAALGGVTDLTTAVDGITSVVNAYGDRIGGAAEASDLMFTAVRRGKTTFEELSASLSNVTPIAAATGVEFQDVTAALATLTSQGVPTAQATTQLRQLFVELGDAGSEAGRAFESVAGESLQEFLAAGGDTADALQLMTEAADAAGVPISQLFGSVEAGTAALALTGENADSFIDNLEEMAGAAGATEAAYDRMDGGLSRAWRRLKVFGDELMLTVGEQLAPTIQRMADHLIANMPTIEAAISTALASIEGFTGSVLPALEALGMWWQVNGPVILLTAQQLAAGLTETWTVIRAQIDQVADWLRATFAEGGTGQGALASFLAQAQEWGVQLHAVIQSALDAVTAVVTFTIEALRVAWALFGDELTVMTSSVWDTIVGVIDGALTLIRGVFEIFAGVFSGDWDRAWGGVKDTFSGVWSIITSVLQGALELIGGALVMAAQGWTETFGHLRDGLAGVWDSIWDRITAKWETARSALISGVSTLVTGMGNAWNGLRSAMAAPINWVAEHVINRFSGAVNRVSDALGGGSIAPSVAVPLVTFHEGGIVGRDGRMTGGPLRPDEMIIKARKGEEVLPAGHPRHRNSRTGEPYDPVADAIGGPFDWIADAAGDVLSAGRDLIAQTVKPLINQLLGQLSGLTSQFGPFGSPVAGAGRKLGEVVLDWIGKADARAEEESIGKIGSGAIAGGWRALVAHIQRAGVPHVVSSTYRPGSITTSGNRSRHSMGLAADFSIGGHGNRGYGSTGLRRIFEAFLPVAGNLHELILAGAPFNIKRGRQVGGYAWGSPGSPGNHWNHVHAALADGGDFDRGGRFLVGEQGAEVVETSGRGRVTPLPDPSPGDVYLDGHKVGQLLAQGQKMSSIPRHHRLATAGVI